MTKATKPSPKADPVRMKHASKMISAALQPIEMTAALHAKAEAVALRACMEKSGVGAAVKAAKEWHSMSERIAGSIKETRAAIVALTEPGATQDAAKIAFVSLMGAMRTIAVAIQSWNRSLAGDAAMGAATSAACIKPFAAFLKKQLLMNAEALELTIKNMPTPPSG